jgi:uncharacterized protein (UPF0276 family)
MIELAVNYFKGLANLAQEMALEFQIVRVGSWCDRDDVDKIVAEFPGKRFLYHHNRNLRADNAETQALIATLQDRQRQTGSPWLSAHLDQHTDVEIHNLLEKGCAPPRYGFEQSLEMLCDAIQTVQTHLPVSLLLENVEHWPLAKVDFAAMPDFICRVLDQAKCGFLLDIAHAEVTADILKRDVRRYIKELPLERVVELHVCGTSRRNGRVVDSHEALQEKDYALLAWLLRCTAPKAVTLEYSRDPAVVPEQIVRLNQIMAGARDA